MPSRVELSEAAIPLAELLRDVVSIPTASYLEWGVRSYIRGFAERLGLAYTEDEFGNAYVRYQRGRTRRPLVLGAHMDHPGFVVRERRGQVAELEFRGGLGAQFGAGERLRLFSAERLEAAGRARVVEVRDANGRITGAAAELEGGAEVVAGDLALWDVPAFELRGTLVRARQCDDLAGCAAILGVLERVARARTPGTLIGLFTRAEEVGLRGASAAARARLLPEDALVIAVETSSMAGGRAEQGAGPIIRVGDALHVFSPAMTQWMTSTAQELAVLGDGFRYQRKLMDGGVTEATAYDLYGYETGAACIALGNYHNAGARSKVAPETVDLGDLEGLVRLFVRMFETVPAFERALPSLKRRYDRLAREAGPLLRRSRGPATS
ncbi:MAG: M20/M25/M40 family metallo-hydrolase [Dehalococcoidia bacterium]